MHGGTHAQFETLCPVNFFEVGGIIIIIIMIMNIYFKSPSVSLTYGTQLKDDDLEIENHL